MAKIKDMVGCFEGTGMPAELLVSIAWVESRLNPYAVNIQTNRKIDKFLRGINYRRSKGYKARYMYSVYPKTKEEAGHVIRIAKLYSVTYDVGLMQINESNFSLLRRKGLMESPYDLLDPCKNVKAGAYILRKCFEIYGLSSSALDCYNRGPAGARRWSSYVEKVANVLSILLERGVRW